MGEAFAPPSRRNPEAEPREVPVIELYPEEGKVRILDVALDVLPVPEDPLARRFIPSWKRLEKSVCWDEPTVLLVRDMAVRLAGGIPSRSEGPTGVSKSFAVEVLAALTNRSFLRHNYNRDSDPGDTIGRFVPSDATLAVRFEELLADPELKPASQAIIEKAQAANRPLTGHESRRIASLENLSGLEDLTLWRWKNGTLTGAMMYGSVFGADEPNLASGNVLERENSVLEKRPQLRIVEHDGEVIRGLTPEEQSIIDDGGVIPGVIGLDQDFWYTAAQNPWGIGGGRTEESEARRNRLQDRIVGALTTEEYETYLRFLIQGEQPDITWGTRSYKGDKNATTGYRDLNKIPNIEVVIPWLAQFQTDLEELVKRGQIGREKDIKGGSYVYTRRNMERFLDSFKGAQKALLDTDKLFTDDDLAFNDNPRDLFTEALYQEYLAGMCKEDADLVRELIAASGIVEQLGPSVNNPTPPSWVKSAQEGGLEVSNRNGEWVLRRTDLTQEQNAALGRILVEAIDAGYTSTAEDNDIVMEMPIRDILDVHREKFPPEVPVANAAERTEE